MEKKMADEKKFCIKNTSVLASQCGTVSTADSNSQISSISSLSSEEPQWSVVSTSENSSLNLHSGGSFSTSEFQDSLNSLDERCSLKGSNLSLKSADSSQPKTYSFDSTSESVIGFESTSCKSENSLKLDSFSNADRSLKAEEICLPVSASPSEKNSICKDDFKSDSGDCRPGAGSPDVFKECVSDNMTTKKRAYHQISRSSQEVSEQNLDSQDIKEVDQPNSDSQHVQLGLPYKKFKPDLQVGKESHNNGVREESCIQDSEAGSFSYTHQKSSKYDSSQSLLKPTFMEADLFLEDAQKENTPFETQQTEMDEAEEYQ